MNCMYYNNELYCMYYNNELYCMYYNNELLKSKLLTSYSDSRLSQFRYTRGKKKTPAPFFFH